MQLGGCNQRLHRGRPLRRNPTRLAAAALCSASTAASTACSARDVRQIGELERLSASAATHAAAAAAAAAISTTATTSTAAAANQLNLWQSLDARLRHRRQQPKEPNVERFRPTHRSSAGGGERHLCYRQMQQHNR